MVSEVEDREEVTLTEDEAALYDRQLRLWGLDAQKRLINSNILVIGLGGMGAELCKNIILGGVKSVTLMDPSNVSPLDAACQFLVARDSIGKNRAEASLANAQKLNPMVSVMAETVSPDEKPDEFFEKFTVIVTSNCSRKQVLRLNRLARLKSISFFAADVFGFMGYVFSDLGEHSYKKYGVDKEVITPATKTIPEVVKVMEGTLRYAPFQDILHLDWTLDDMAKRIKKTNSGFFALFVLLDFVEQKNRRPDPAHRSEDYEELLKLRDAYVEKQGISKERVPDELFANVFGELAPVAAVTGGVLAQEVVKAVSRKDIPLINLFVYNPVDGTGYVENFAG